MTDKQSILRNQSSPSTSSSPSSSCSVTSLSQRMTDMDSSPAPETVVVKIFSRVLSPDVEYKTISITKKTTCKEVIQMLLAKFRLKHRDPNLFFLTIEVWIRKTGIPLRSVMVLDENACPAHLQSVYPHQGTKFTLQMRRGGLVKIHDSCLSTTGSQYRSHLISHITTVQELIQLILNSYHCQESPSSFSLHEACPTQKIDRKLHQDEFPLRIQEEWPTHDLVFFQLKRKSKPSDDQLPVQRRAFSWTRIIDETGNVTFRYKLSRDNLHEDVNQTSLDQSSSCGSSESLTSKFKTTTSTTSSSSCSSSVSSSQTSCCSPSTSSSEYENFYI